MIKADDSISVSTDISGKYNPRTRRVSVGEADYELPDKKKISIGEEDYEV